jgi:hypothetical protein
MFEPSIISSEAYDKVGYSRGSSKILSEVMISLNMRRAGFFYTKAQGDIQVREVWEGAKLVTHITFHNSQALKHW